MDVKNALAAHEIGEGQHFIYDLRIYDLRIDDFFLRFATKASEARVRIYDYYFFLFTTDYTDYTD